MAHLIREQAAGIIGKREWWSLFDCTAVVAFGKDGCGVCVIDKDRRDITEAVAAGLRGHYGRNVSLVSTIDSFLIECQQADIAPLLAEIEGFLSSEESDCSD